MEATTLQVLGAKCVLDDGPPGITVEILDGFNKFGDSGGNIVLVLTCINSSFTFVLVVALREVGILLGIWGTRFKGTDVTLMAGHGRDDVLTSFSVKATWDVIFGLAPLAANWQSEQIQSRSATSWPTSTH